MSLPEINPVDTKCVPRGWPLTHIGSRAIWCPKCEGNGYGHRQEGEAYMAARPPWLVSPHKRPLALEGNVGRSSGDLGAPGLMEQCSRCSVVYLDAADGTARWWGERTGMVILAAAATSPVGAPERPLLVSADMLPSEPGDGTEDAETAEDAAATPGQADTWRGVDTMRFLVQGWISSHDIRCGWCGQARSTSIVPLPPLSWCDSYHEWQRFGGHLMPSCGPCADRRAMDDDWTPPRLSLRKTARNLKRTHLFIQQIADELSQQLGLR